MLQITLAGSKHDALLAAYVLQTVFEGVQVHINAGVGEQRCIEMTAQQLPGNAMMLSILQQAQIIEAAAVVTA